MTTIPPNLIFLIGLRGSGKTTLGRLLAEKLGAQFDDLDDLVRAHFTVDSITDIWEAHGESAFREQEAEQIKSIIAAHAPAGQESAKRVIALGGGSPTAPGAKEALAEAQSGAICDIIYLDALPETLAERINTSDPDRPSLTGTDPVREVAAVHAHRHPIYAQLARHSIDASGSIEDVIMRILDALGYDSA